MALISVYGLANIKFLRGNLCRNDDSIADGKSSISKIKYAQIIALE